MRGPMVDALSMNAHPTEGKTMKQSNVVRPLEWWQVIEMATARQLSRQRSAEIRQRMERSISTLASLDSLKQAVR